MAPPCLVTGPELPHPRQVVWDASHADCGRRIAARDSGRRLGCVQPARPCRSRRAVRRCCCPNDLAALIMTRPSSGRLPQHVGHGSARDGHEHHSGARHSVGDRGRICALPGFRRAHEPDRKGHVPGEERRITPGPRRGEHLGPPAPPPRPRRLAAGGPHRPACLVFGDDGQHRRIAGILEYPAGQGAGRVIVWRAASARARAPLDPR